MDGTKLADDAVDSEHYTDGSIDNAHLADDAVDSDELAAGAVDTAHIADNQITLAKMAGLARGKLIYGDSSGDPAALAVGSADEVLTHDGTDLAWAAAGGGGMTLIELQTADTSATPVVDDLLFDDVFTSTYKDYLITGTIGLETTATDFYFNFADGTTVRTDSNYLGLASCASVNSSDVVADASFGDFAVAQIIFADNATSTAGSGPVFNIWCIDPLKTSKGLPFYTGTISYFTPESLHISGTIAGHYGNGISITGFNISPSADGMNRYKVAVFGLHTS